MPLTLAEIAGDELRARTEHWMTRGYSPAKAEAMAADEIMLRDALDECEHEWEPLHAGYTERCSECGETRDYDGSQDDGRDFTPPYEP